MPTSVGSSKKQERIRQNKELPTRPVLRMIKDKDGKEYQKSVEKDLLVELDLFIEDTL